MTSKQVLLTLVVVVTCLTGCSLFGPRRAPELVSPYPETRVIAVVPFVNESGTTAADGQRVADSLTRSLDRSEGLVALPLTRVLTVMDQLGLSGVSSMGEARMLLQYLDAELLVVGTITAYDPYDPPRLGMAAEVYEYLAPPVQMVDLRVMTKAGTSNETAPDERHSGRVLVSLSAMLDASNPRTRDRLMDYAVDRGVRPEDPDAWLHIKRSMNLYTDFACHELARRLLAAETIRLAPAEPDETRGSDNDRPKRVGHR
ncbi:hypothetical protein [Mucisphaera calidilacus]|uniref:Uncharacterized protein n=1 Tax=Mucisphaera calidilacus TaxID=2527982 RepID=A0A518BZD3_9BACT|nr:hypothetical protein [Mucisphaera calidilacus]QDU72328.1 hypothetical protein Pan265_21930 [Mucisphaera calidilacus]